MFITQMCLDIELKGVVDPEAKRINKTIKRKYCHHVSFLVPGCKPMGPIDSPLCVCPSVPLSVLPFVTDYLGNRLMKFSEIWYVDAF